jgi:hypothetical protein
MKNLQDEISKKSTGYAVPSEIIHAIAVVESDLAMDMVCAVPFHEWLWDTLSFRPFRRLHPSEHDAMTAPADFKTRLLYDPDTEWLGQRMAWGPWQMPGATLRLTGFTGPFPLICCDAEQAALWACRHLSSLRDKYFERHGWAGTVAAFKTGRPRRTATGEYTCEEWLVHVRKAGAKRFL